MSEDKLQDQHDEQLDNDADVETRDQDQVEDDFVKIPKADYQKLKKTVKTANTEAQKRREQLEQYKSSGLEPDEIKELVELRERKESGQDTNPDQIDRKELDRQRAKLEKQHAQQLQELKEKLDFERKRTERTLIESTAREAIVANKGRPALILDQVVRSSRLVENDRGGYDVRVVDSEGNFEFNDQGEYMTITDHIKALKNHEDYGRAFDVEPKRGAGIQNQNGNSGTKHSVTKAELQGDKKARYAFIAKHGIEAYNKLS